jgi:DNA-binding CsgD family transcriptional regulator
MDDRDSLSKLTEREKICLRQWLQHKSAKEIAADLGISHHAVEKRLKMARTKLGATSSLEAARLLLKAEGYGQAVAQSPDLSPPAVPRHSGFIPLTVLGVGIMILVGAIIAGLLLQPAAFTQAPDSPPAAAYGERASINGSVRAAVSEVALRRLVAGLASGSPDYDKLSPKFAEVVRRDLPDTHPLFRSLGELKSVTYRGRGSIGDDVYNLAFANGGVMMSVMLDADDRIAGGMLKPLGPSGEQEFAAGTEAALRGLVAGLASGSPDYGKLSPQFAEVVRRDLPKTQPLFSSMGALKSVTFRERGALGDDVYNLAFAKGEMIMSAKLDAEGRMVGGIIRPVTSPGNAR